MQSFVTSAPSHRALEQVFDRGAYKEAMVALLTHRRMPLSAVEWKEFKRLALACNPAIGDYLLISRRSAVRLIEANYKLYAESLREGLSKAVSLIHLQSDLWTPHRHSILAVCAQWIDHDYAPEGLTWATRVQGRPGAAHDYAGRQEVWDSGEDWLAYQR